MENLVSVLKSRQVVQSTDTGISSTDQSEGLVRNLIWKSNVQHRTSTVVTIVFNILAAFLIIASILFDARRASKHGLAPRTPYKTLSSYPSSSSSRSNLQFFSRIHPADTLPFLISIAVSLQGIILLGVQATGFQSLETEHCRGISQVVWPAIWIVNYTLLVFGIEVAFRGLRKNRFHSRDKFALPICWSVVLALLFATWIPSQVNKNPQDGCAATLLAWAMPWATIGLVLNALILFAYLITGFLIVYRLSDNTKIDHDERTAASRTVCYLIIGVTLMTIVLPFWVRVVQRNSPANAAQAATIAFNAFGLLTGLFYLVLRSRNNTVVSSYGPTASDREQGRGSFASSNINMADHYANSIGLQWDGRHHDSKLSSMEKHGFIMQDSSTSTKSEPIEVQQRPASNHSPKVMNVKDTRLVASPAFAKPSQVAFPEALAQSFTKADDTASPQHLGPMEVFPSSATQTELPTPPPPPILKSPRRALSNVSAATIHIGMSVSSSDLAPEVQEGIRRALTYPPGVHASKVAMGKDQSQLFLRSVDGMLYPLEQVEEGSARNQRSSQRRLSWRLGSLETSPSQSPPSMLDRRRRLEDLISPTYNTPSWLLVRDSKMKSLPPVPVTPTEPHPWSNARASFLAHEFHSSLIQDVRSSQGPTALSLALKEGDHWPLRSVDLGEESFIPNGDSTWI